MLACVQYRSRFAQELLVRLRTLGGRFHRVLFSSISWLLSCNLALTGSRRLIVVAAVVDSSLGSDHIGDLGW